jgi:hypothetical protein
VAEAVGRYALQGSLGPIAIVVDVAMSEYAAELFQARTAKRERPLGIFWTMEDAIDWLQACQTA